MYGIQKIQFPVKDSYNGINSTERGNRGHEQLLVGGSAAKFVTNSLEELLYEYTPNATSDEKVGNFVTAMENLAPVWRPVDYIEEYSSCREKYDVHLLNTYAVNSRISVHFNVMILKYEVYPSLFFHHFHNTRTHFFQYYSRHVCSNALIAQRTQFIRQHSQSDGLRFHLFYDGTRVRVGC